MEVAAKKTRSLRQDLSFIISGMIIFLVTGLCAISFLLAFSSIKKVYFNQLLNVNSDIAKQVSSFYDDHLKYIKFLSESPQVVDAAVSGDYGKVQDFLTKFYGDIGTLENIFISTAEKDTEIVVDGIGGESVGLHWAGSEFDTNIEKALSGQTWISDVYLSPVTSKPIVAITAPIKSGNKVLGIFGLPFDLGKMSAKLVEGNIIGKTGYPFVTTTGGVTFAHPNQENIFKLILQDYDWGQEMMDSPSGTIINYVWEGKNKYLSFVKNDKYSFISAATIYESDISEDVWSMAYIMFAVGIIGIIIIIASTLFFMNQRLKPLKVIVSATDRMADGELDITLEKSRRKVLDETGILLESFIKMLDALKYKAGIVDKIATGDLTNDVKIASDKDQLGKSLVLMTDTLNDLLTQVKMSVEQVNTGADQVAQASQSLSQGATEQASSLEEISASVTQINSQSKQNAENATEANALAKQASVDADKGNKQMDELTKAMEKINVSSDQIKKVVKVIDDIAFQTNLLALNANVEAARAGKYGKGFAVVADEVRNLAVRSADAVKETTQMVDDSLKNIEAGNNSTQATAVQLKSIMDGSTKVADFLEEIAEASKEQAQAIDQITLGLDQIDQVTQSNTASAEESAAASEELASQSIQLKKMIDTFKLKSGKGNFSRSVPKLSYGNSVKEQRSAARNEEASAFFPNEDIHSDNFDSQDFDRF